MAKKNYKEIKKLTAKEEIFCKEYITSLNGTASYKIAFESTCKTDGTARTNATKLLAKAYIKQRVNELMEERSNRVELTSDDVLRDIIEVKDRCMEKENFKENGALKALELLGKHLKMFTDKIEHSGKLSLEELIGKTFKDDE